MVSLLPQYKKLTKKKPCYNCNRVTTHLKQLDRHLEVWYTCIKCGNTL